MSDPIYEILDHLRKEVQSLRVENERLRRSRNDEIAAAGDLRKKIERLRAGLQRIVEGDGFWDAPSLARDLLAGKDVT
jgi:hypothetical protein